PHLLKQSRDDERPDCDRRHEMTVHDVDVDDACSRREHLAHLLAQAAEISGEDRRRHAHAAEQLAWRGAHMGCSIESPQWLHCSTAVADILTIVECSPQLGHTEVSSKRCRQYTQR